MKRRTHAAIVVLATALASCGADEPPGDDAIADLRATCAKAARAVGDSRNLADIAAAHRSIARTPVTDVPAAKRVAADTLVRSARRIAADLDTARRTSVLSRGRSQAADAAVDDAATLARAARQLGVRCEAGAVPAADVILAAHYRSRLRSGVRRFVRRAAAPKRTLDVIYGLQRDLSAALPPSYLRSDHQHLEDVLGETQHAFDDLAHPDVAIGSRTATRRREARAKRAAERLFATLRSTLART